MSKRRRALSDEERRLWDLVRETAEPLRSKAPADVEAVSAPPEPAKPPAPPKATPAARPVAAKTPPAAASKPAAPLDRRTRSRLSRGILEIDARIDLHGLTQTVAHQRLHHFLEGAQASGSRLVLVITGKGAAAEPGDRTAPERGVLRRAVPEWLRSAAFSRLVAGFDEAGRRHGGGGALYVRIRRKRGGPSA